MNFDLENLFGGGMAKLSALEDCENSWKVVYYKLDTVHKKARIKYAKKR